MGYTLFVIGISTVLIAAAFGNLPMAIVGCAALVAATTWFRGDED